jgi:hypothetical protein
MSEPLAQAGLTVLQSGAGSGVSPPLVEACRARTQRTHTRPCPTAAPIPFQKTTSVAAPEFSECYATLGTPPLFHARPGVGLRGSH